MFQACQFAYRQIRRSPGFAITATLIIAIGIGVTTAMYSILYAVILQPLPFAHPDDAELVGFLGACANTAGTGNVDLQETVAFLNGIGCKGTANRGSSG